MYVTNCCLTNAYSDPDVRQVTSHAGTLCADQKLAVPESVKLKISSRKFIKCSLSCSYPALNACITLSFSSLVLSPLSFSMWAGVRYWRFRDLALHWAQDAAHEMHGGLNIHSDIHYNFYRGYLLCPFAIQRFAFWDCRYCQQEEGRSMSTPCQYSCRNLSSAYAYAYHAHSITLSCKWLTKCPLSSEFVYTAGRCLVCHSCLTTQTPHLCQCLDWLWSAQGCPCLGWQS